MRSRETIHIASLLHMRMYNALSDLLNLCFKAKWNWPNYAKNKFFHLPRFIFLSHNANDIQNMVFSSYLLSISFYVAINTSSGKSFSSLNDIS
jgi:hypothetical protein